MTSMDPSLSDKSPFPRARGRRRWPLYLSGVLLGAVLVAGFWPRPLKVETGRVTRGPMTVSVLEEGKTRIRSRYVISPPISGYLNRVDLRPGAAVEAGKTVLAVIEAGPSGFLDPRTLAERQAREKAAEAAVSLRKSELSRARAALDLAKKAFSRIDALRKSEVASEQDWDTAENRVTVLTRDVGSAEFALQVAEFELSQAKAALKGTGTLEAGAEPLRIHSPVDGVVLNVYEESARAIAPGTRIMEVGDPKDLEVEVELFSSDAAAIQTGAPVLVEQWGGEKPLRGRVQIVEKGGFTKISALGVEEQRVIVRVDLVDPLPEGYTLGDRFHVETKIDVWHGDDVLQVPVAALFRKGSDWMVFSVEKRTARLEKLSIGRNNGTMAEVRSGLSEGERVILHPPETLADGSRISPDD